jgi:DNA-binding NarL/FixJ family response regulator
MARNCDLLIVENSPILREKIAGILSRMDEVRLVSQITDLRDVVAVVRELMPDIVLIDMRLVRDRADIPAALRDACPKITLVLLAEEDGENYRAAAERLKADRLVALARLEVELKKTIGEVVRAKTDAPNGNGNSGKRMVLIADDDAFYRKRMESAVEELDMSTKGIVSGREAIREIQIEPDRFSCVVLDVHMEGMGGIEASLLIRKRNPELPVIIVTSDDLPETERSARETGAASFLRKPFDMKLFKDAVLRAMESRYGK